MQIDLSAATISILSGHDVGNKNNGEQLYITTEPLAFTDESLIESLHHYFLKPFNQPIFYQFTSSTNHPELNPVCQFSASVFEDERSFHMQSIHFAKHLFECTQHPNIKAGDLFVAYIEHCLVDGQTCNAIGLFKAEHKDPFIISERSGKKYKMTLERGFDINNLDKGALIFNVHAESGYRVCSIDKSTRGADAQFWKDDFLGIVSCADNYHFTHNFLSVTKAFVTTELPESFEVSRADQIDLLNKSVAYFKENERFNEQEFAQHLFADQEVIDSFTKFKNTMASEAELDLKGSFDISTQAVAKQARVFKSVLKLDKNFHIYIHGNRELIERGEDHDGRKYYKIYYTEEH